MKKWCCCFVRIIIKSNNLSHRSYENWLKWCLCHCSSVVYAHKRFDAWEECVKIKLCLCCRHHNNASKLFSILYSMFAFSIEPKWLQNLDVVDCVSASQRLSVTALYDEQRQGIHHLLFPETISAWNVSICF